MRMNQYNMTKTNTKWQKIEDRFNLSGVQYSDYQLVVGTPVGKTVDLIGEPSNQYDRDAIRVEYMGIKLGYIPSKSIFQSELIRYHKQGCKCIGIITAFSKANPTWRMITIQLMRTEPEGVKEQQEKEIHYGK